MSKQEFDEYGINELQDMIACGKVDGGFKQPLSERLFQFAVRNEE
jgi:hypothetical protein